MKKILLIEDDEIMTRIVARILPSTEYQLEHAANGKEALQRLEASNYAYDLVITDIMMPYANGFEILSKIKQRNRALPVIIISNAGNEGAIMEGFKLGADDFLKKPILPVELLIRVKKLLMKNS